MVSEGGAEPDGGVELTLNRLGRHRAPRAVDLPDELNDLGREPDQNLGNRKSLTIDARKERCEIDVKDPYRLLLSLRLLNHGRQWEPGVNSTIPR